MIRDSRRWTREGEKPSSVLGQTVNTRHLVSDSLCPKKYFDGRHLVSYVVTGQEHHTGGDDRYNTGKMPLRELVEPRRELGVSMAC